MADIKTRNVVKGTIKTIDKAAIAADRMKTGYLKTKDRAESSYYADEISPSQHAINTMGKKSEFMAREGAYRLNHTGKKSIGTSKRQFIKAKNNLKQVGHITKGRTKGGDIKSRKLKTGSVIKGKNHSILEGNKALKRNLAVRNLQRNIQRNKLAARTIKQTAVAAAHAVKAVIAGMRALISAIIAGGWIAVIVIIVCCLFGAAFYFFGDSGSDSYTPVSQEVESYTPVIEKYAKEYGISEYVELIKAVMMQESGGKGKDPMQASECSFNTKYPKTPNGITDPEYSIKCGIQNLKSVLVEAKVQNPVDMDRIKLALQGYNYGNGYISWAVSKYGGYTKANAIEFSKAQAKKNGWSSYGDQDYVEHVLRYYPYGDYSYDIVFSGTGKLGLPIEGMTQSNISSHFGPRSSPGGIGSTNHKGIDIAFPLGTHVLACESGTVISAGWNGGLGNCIIVDHGKGLQTVYGHLSKIHVKKGQKVVRGQFIGEVGSTGNSTGPHLHLGVKVNGSYVNPEKGYLNISK